MAPTANPDLPELYILQCSLIYCKRERQGFWRRECSTAIKPHKFYSSN